MLWKKLGFSYLRSGWAFWAVSHFEANVVAFAQFAEAYAVQLVSMEKQIFLAIALADKTEVLVSQFLDCSLHGECRNKVN